MARTSCVFSSGAERWLTTVHVTLYYMSVASKVAISKAIALDGETRAVACLGLDGQGPQAPNKQTSEVSRRLSLSSQSPSSQK